jgi:methylmalonyl-CoA mutase N-terminal domain/subunit
LKVDDFAHRLSFFFASHNDFFEEIAKFRAARRLWAKIMKERFPREKPKVHVDAHARPNFRLHVNSAAATKQHCTHNNTGFSSSFRRNTVSAHKLFRRGFMPSNRRVCEVALRTQQIIAYESGVTNTVDPLAGSYYVEALTMRWRRKPWNTFKKSTIWAGQ